MTLPSTHDDADGPRFPSDRSERARAMVEAGIFGGAGRGQGRKPKGRTAGESVAELAAAEAPAIKRAYSDGLRSKNERTRLYAADKLLAAERVERERRDDEDWIPSDAEWQRMTGAELDAWFELAIERHPDEIVMAFRAAISEGLLEHVVVDSVAIES